MRKERTKMIHLGKFHQYMHERLWLINSCKDMLEKTTSFSINRTVTSILQKQKEPTSIHSRINFQREYA